MQCNVKKWQSIINNSEQRHQRLRGDEAEYKIFYLPEIHENEDCEKKGDDGDRVAQQENERLPVHRNSFESISQH